MKKVSQPNYSVSQSELYSIMRTAWNNCLSFIADFSAHKPLYRPELIESKLAAIDAAQTIANDDFRSGHHEIMRIELIELNDKCCENFLKLETYIQSGFPESQFKSLTNMAGKSNYRNAFQRNWDATVLLNSMMINFIDENLKSLTANHNMPAEFQKLVTDTDAEFNLKYEAFKSARQTSNQTSLKIDANNAIYNDCLMMMDDGKVIFRKEPEKRILFTFSTIAGLITNPGASNLKIVAVDQLTNQPLTGVNLQLQSDGGVLITGVTDNSGSFTTESIDADTYDGKAEKEGYVTATFTKEVNTGTEARLTIILTKAA